MANDSGFMSFFTWVLLHTQSSDTTGLVLWFPQTDKPYVIVCWVLTWRIAWCHLIYLGWKNLISSPCGCWGMGWGLSKFSLMYCMSSLLMWNLSHTVKPKAKPVCLCSPFSCALIMWKVMRCVLGWEDHRDNEWQNNDGTTITEMYSCRLALQGPVTPLEFVR